MVAEGRPLMRHCQKKKESPLKKEYFESRNEDFPGRKYTGGGSQ